MRIIRMLLLCLALSNSAPAQNYFNSRQSFPFSLAEGAYSILADSSGYSVLCGATYDTLGGQLVCHFFNMDHAAQSYDTSIYRFPYAFIYEGWQGSMSRTADGFVFGGAIEDTLQTDVLLVKLRSNGDTLWTRRLGDSLFQAGSMAKQYTDGGFVVCGQTSSNTMYADMLLMRTDSLGNILFEKQYGVDTCAEYAFAFAITSDGGFALAGERHGPDNWDIFVVKTDSLGNQEWERIIDLSLFDRAWSIQATPNGNLVIGGASSFYSGQAHALYMATLDSSGNVLWGRTYGEDTASISEFKAIKLLEDGNIIATGFHWPPYPFGQPDSRYGIIYKIAPNGDSLWSRKYYNGHPTNKNYLFDIAQDIDGGFVTSGWVIPVAPDSGRQSIWILKVDSLGCEVSNCTLGVEDNYRDDTRVSIFPNPFSNQFTISLSETSNRCILKMFNVLGEEITALELKAGINYLTTSEMASGIYIIKLVEADRVIYSSRVIKN